MKRWTTALLALATGSAAAALPGTTMPQNFEPTYYSYDLPSYADAVTIGDLTGDGFDDVVVTTSGLWDDALDRSVYLFVQQADGLLQVPWRYEDQARGDDTGLALGDFNGDHLLDVVVSHYDGLTLMLNTGKREDRFVIKQFPGLLNKSLTVADIDLDGHADAVTTAADQDIHVYYGDGAGGFRSIAPLPVGHGSTFVRVADMNGDRLPDLVVSWAPPWTSVHSIEVMFRNRDGSYRQLQKVGDYATSFAIGDFNHDGLPDVAAYYSGWRGDFPAIYFQRPGHWFVADPARVPGYANRGPMAAADLNGDGRDDMMLLMHGNPALYSNMQGSAGMEPQALDFMPQDMDVNDRNGLAVGDINHDGCPDAVAAIDNVGLAWLYGNTCPQRTDLAVAIGFDTSAVAVRLSNVSRELTPVAAPTAEIDVRVVAPATLQLGTLPPGCRVLAQTPDRARVQCGVAALAYGAQAELSLPLQITSTAPGSAVVAVTARTTTPELRLDNNRAGKRIAVPSTAPAAAASAPAPRRTGAAPARMRINRTEPRR
jgi:hypothetical protein